VEIEVDRAKEGLKTAIAQVHNPADLPPDSENAEQLVFFPEMPLPVDSSGRLGGGARGRGRPAGAKNKNTEAWREFLLQTGRSPLEVLQQTFSMSLQKLGVALGKKGDLTFDQAVELYKLQLMAAKELAPYIHSKMPTEIIDNGDRGLIQLVINQGQAVAQVGADAIPQAIKFLNSQDEENQLVSDADFSQSNDWSSNENE